MLTSKDPVKVLIEVGEMLGCPWDTKEDCIKAAEIARHIDEFLCPDDIHTITVEGGPMAPAGYSSFAVVEPSDSETPTTLSFAKADNPEEHPDQEVAISIVTKDGKSILRTWYCSSEHWNRRVMAATPPDPPKVARRKGRSGDASMEATPDG